MSTFTNDKILVHIIDKNGHHTTRWMSKEEYQKEHDHKLLRPVQAGDKVHHGGEIHTYVKPDKTGDYMYLESPDGKKHYKKVSSVNVLNPEENPADIDVSKLKQLKSTQGGSQNSDEETPLDYDIYGTPTERMQDWDKLIRNFAEDNCRNLTIAYGTGGVGKTYSVLTNSKIDKELESGEVVKFTGGTTPGGFFEMLYRNRDKKIILDDFDMVFNDPNMLALITTISSNTGRRYLSSPVSGSLFNDEGDKIPSRFNFTGKIMIISNINIDQQAVSGNNQEKFREILTNADKVDLKLTRKETWDLMNGKILHDARKIVNGEPNPNFGKINPNLKFKDAYGNNRFVSQEGKQELVDYFSKNWNNMVELSGRTLTKANAIREYYTKKGEDWTKKADEMLLKDKPAMSINERYDVFGDSIDMIAKGKLKSAAIIAKNPQDVIEALEDNGLFESHRGFELVDEQNPDLEREDEETSVKDMYVEIKGKDLTDKALYENLWKHNGKVIVFNKTAKGFLKSDLGQGLLKGALDTSGDGEVCWLSSMNTGKMRPSYKKNDFENGDDFAEQLRTDGYRFEMDDNGNPDMSTISHPYDLPDKFSFKGRCVFIVDSEEDVPQPIQSRSMVADIKATPEEFVERSKYVFNHRKEKGKEFSNVFKNVTSEEYNDAVKFLQDNLKTGKVADHYYSEEGIQKYIRKVREGDNDERSLMREFMKSRFDLALGTI